MDAITLLKNDHRSVEKLFKRFEHAGEKAYAEKRKLVDRIIEELSQHAAIEEQVFYPVARATVPGTEDLTLESLEEHHIVKWVLSELEGMDPHDERFDAKVTVLIENVRHHVEEEETEFFPKVRDRLGRNDLGEVGEALAEAKEGAPTRPHPRSPDTPPANLVAGAAAGVIDKVSDTVSGLAQGGVSVVQDLIARISHRASPASGPTGSTAARKRARGVRHAGSAAVDGAGRTARTAGTGVRSTAKAAKSGAKGTATTARSSAKKTARTAKRATTTTGRTAAKSAKRTTAAAKRGANRTRAASHSG
jgi:hemerythrin-like domain-containing protein